MTQNKKQEIIEVQEEAQKKLDIINYKYKNIDKYNELLDYIEQIGKQDKEEINL